MKLSHPTYAVTDAAHCRLDVNVALNRPTFMSSVHHHASYGGYYEGSRAVDGNNNTVGHTAVGNSCTSTGYQAYAWWAVDLGAAVAVFCIYLTSRAEGYGNEPLRLLCCTPRGAKWE